MNNLISRDSEEFKKVEVIFDKARTEILNSDNFTVYKAIHLIDKIAQELENCIVEPLS